MNNNKTEHQRDKQHLSYINQRQQTHTQHTKDNRHTTTQQTQQQNNHNNNNTQTTKTQTPTTNTHTNQTNTHTQTKHAEKKRLICLFGIMLLSYVLRFGLPRRQIHIQIQ